MKIKVVAIAKDEAAYLPEWCFHHLYFGFDACEVWLNNITDNSHDICKELESITHGKFKSILADDLLEKCLQEGLNFQTEAYNVAFGQARRQGFSHVLFIDLDELWTPQDFMSSVSKYFSDHDMGRAGVVSFNWLIDTPHDLREAFSRPYTNLMWMHANRHVKSIVNTSALVDRVNIHTAKLKKNDYYCLEDSSYFDLVDDDQHARALISKDRFELIRNEVPKAFIYHRIYRSQHEYLSSLDKGRRHASNDRRPFKVNRLGYRPDFKSARANRYDIDQNKLNDYEWAWCKFRTSNLLEMQFDARRFITDRYERVVAKLQSDSFYLFARYQGLFHTVTDKKIQELRKVLNWGNRPETVNYVIIESAIISEKKLRLTGYGFNLHSRKKILEAKAVSTSGQEYDLLVTACRPSISADLFDKLPENCGFNMESLNEWEGKLMALKVKIGSVEYVVPNIFYPSSIMLPGA
ncbi:glycosyltransferase family 2 protein [Cobetia sp. 1AS1]|uniref:glycosyltransferase family 2 protein n=1 Tax=Cobetia sp. 1AS1 TaxID=3040016 RepID=UPI002448F07C|nr:glycosyltransferase family 2 protein [Cobetia sp. 1AS1]MDH2294256.1 glycosyltransferase family 2 protein [Cobetia sp. 1AS1]